MFRRLFVIGAVSVLAACGGGGGDDVNLSGLWTGTSTGTINGVAATGSGRWTLAQSGSRVTGVSIGDNGLSSTIEATFDGRTLTGISTPSNPNNCSGQFVLTYSNNTLTGQSVTINCSAYISANVVMRR